MLLAIPPGNVGSDASEDQNRAHEAEDKENDKKAKQGTTCQQ